MRCDNETTEGALPGFVDPAFSNFAAFRHRLRLECICPSFSQTLDGNLPTKQTLDTLQTRPGHLPQQAVVSALKESAWLPGSPFNSPTISKTLLQTVLVRHNFNNAII